MQQYWQQSKVVLSLLLFLSITGWAGGQDHWWHPYEQGTSHAEQKRWAAAIAAFQDAIKVRPDDQRSVPTTSSHVIDYFPHRELGIVYYYLGRYPEAIGELETSLRMAETAKAKFYLNKARQAQLAQTQRDSTPPRLVLYSPANGLVTKHRTITVMGHATDDTYVSAISINGQAQFIEVAAPRVPFAQEVGLQEGLNIIDVNAVDLVGQQTHQRITVHVDRQGPLVSLESVELLGNFSHRRARVQGYLFDHSHVVRFVLANREVPLRPEREWAFREEILLVAGMISIPFEVEDAAGNVTRGEIDLMSAKGG